jgi:hypothetical protein
MMMMSVEHSVECLKRETEVRGENLSQCRFVHHKFHMTLPGLEFGQVINRLSYGTARSSSSCFRTFYFCPFSLF